MVSRRLPPRLLRPTAGRWGRPLSLTVASPGTATNVSQTTDRTEGFGLIEWSPGGERIAYNANDESVASNTLGWGVFVSPASGTAEPTAIGSTTASEGGGRWSNDGTRIAFHRSPGGIFLGNADGTGTPDFVPNTGGGYNPDLSPDGTLIASIIDAGTDTIRVSRVDGTGTPVTLGDTTGLIVHGPFFSPDGTRVMWKTQNTIYVRKADGSGTTTTITGPHGMPGYPMSWSPDGTRIAFSGSDGGSNFLIFVANADGTGTARALTSGPQDVYPTWKPDPDATASPIPPIPPIRPIPTPSHRPTPRSPTPARR